MISFNSASNKNKDVDKQARLAGIRQISDWVEHELPEDEQETTSVMVNQIECKEEGCPPVECVIALLRKPKLVFKIFKPVVEVTQPEVVAALKVALAKEATELQAAHGHDHAGHADAKHGSTEHGHAEATHGGEHGGEHGHGGDCCGADHGHAEEKGAAHEHGHEEHGHAEKAVHAHEGECCGHDHSEEKAEAEHAHGH